jgi:hypothetical protein
MFRMFFTQAAQVEPLLLTEIEPCLVSGSSDTAFLPVLSCILMTGSLLL